MPDCQGGHLRGRGRSLGLGTWVKGALALSVAFAGGCVCVLLVSLKIHAENMHVLPLYISLLFPSVISLIHSSGYPVPSPRLRGLTPMQYPSRAGSSCYKLSCSPHSLPAGHEVNPTVWLGRLRLRRDACASVHTFKPRGPERIPTQVDPGLSYPHAPSPKLGVERELDCCLGQMLRKASLEEKELKEGPARSLSLGLQAAAGLGMAWVSPYRSISVEGLS